MRTPPFIGVRIGSHLNRNAFGTPHSSSSKLHAPLEVAKGYHMGYIKAKINLS